MDKRSSRVEKRSKAAHCHVMIRETAQALAHELYDQLMKDDNIFKAWKAQNPGLNAKALEATFVASKWGLCVEPARTTLTLLLRGNLDEAVKDSIYTALCLDRTLVRGRQDPPMILGEA